LILCVYSTTVTFTGDINEHTAIQHEKIQDISDDTNDNNKPNPLPQAAEIVA
jgi:hypothetical protein